MSARRAERRAAERRNRSRRPLRPPTPPGLQRALDHLLGSKRPSPPEYDVDRFVLVARYDAGSVQTTLHELPVMLVLLRSIGDDDIARAIEAGRFPGGLTMLAIAADGWRVLTVCWPELALQHAFDRRAKT